ncbi:MAG: double-strand break repair helicase AddA, partial [Rhodospirillaceae bacterium]|nr:double-strand break repair helicase AddA [Rhodospirillaceae bacterium]
MSTGPTSQFKRIGKATASQLGASDPVRSVWVSANAGTGKTRVLVDRIARILLSGARPEKILCLTFTKTAAAEMAERINRRLGHWVVMNDADLSAELTDLTQKKPDDETMKRARALFARVLETPGGLKIRTIHSFAESLLARFPLEAGVAPHFSVIDERSAAELMNEAQGGVLENIYQQQKSSKNISEITMAMRHLAELVNEDGFSGLMRELMYARAKLAAILKSLKNGGNNIDGAVLKMVGLGPDEASIEQIVKNASAENAFDKENLARAVSALTNGTEKTKEKSAVIEKWINADIKTREKLFLTNYILAFSKKDGGPLAKLTTKGVDDFDATAADILLNEQARILKVLDKIKCVQTAQATAALLKVGGAIENEYRTLKASSGGLDYDDLIEKACALLENESGASWVHFKLDGGIDHILVDESQDTSPQQWAVVKGLAFDFFSGQGRDDETVRTVFAVGDEKQSIYSFQGADPYEFGRMREYFEQKVIDAEKQFSALQLTTSFRSTRAVLAIVDRVFANPVAFDGLSFADEEVLHKSHREGEAGLVELWQPELPEGAVDVDPWDAPLDRLSIKSPEIKLAERIGATIKGWLENGEILKSKNRPIRADDILILVRKRGAFADEMVRQLKLNGVEVAGSDRMVLTDQIAVEDLMALGNFCLLPEDDLNTAALLKSPIIGMGEDDLMHLANGRATSIWAALKKHAKEKNIFAQAFTILSEHLGRADYQPPYEFFAGVLNGGARKALVARLGSDAEDPIDEFISLALQFERAHTPSLQGFLHWVKSGATEIKRDMEITGSKVRVMTVHGAKGLEANIVFLPDTCTTPSYQHDSRIYWKIPAPGQTKNQNPQMLWAPYKEMRPEIVTKLVDEGRSLREREYRRLLYVAMTRARDRLYVGGYATEKGPADGSWYNLMAGPIKERGVERDSPFGKVWRYETEQQAQTTDVAEDEKIISAPLPKWASTPPGAEQTPPK